MRGVGSSQERTGVLVIRVWVEGDEERFRARITQSLDVTAAEQVVSSAASVEDISAAVRAWLDAFIAK
jgi:hypothetical protein